MDIDNSIAKHAEWKQAFQTAISRQMMLDATTIAKDDCCELGEWLHGDAKEKLSHLPSYSDCVKKHADFHKEASKIAQAINQKKFEEANAMLEAGTPYAASSTAVGIALIDLKLEASL